MILIGQYDSPFVRRVGIALHIYGIAYDHEPWSTFRQGDRVAAYNPLRRVPTLVLDDGEVLIESGAILDWLDEMAGPGKALIPPHGLERRATLKIAALATGLCDKMVSLVYERLLHAETSDIWVARCETQIGGVLAALEADRATRGTPWWFGDRLTHADIAAGCAMRFLGEAHAGLYSPDRWPALTAHAARCEALAAFRSVVQEFIPPAR